MAQPDLGYMFALFALISIGMVMVYSTTALVAGNLLKMGIWLALGVPVIVIAARVPMLFWRRVTPIALMLCYLALISLEVPHNPLAVNVNGATRWLKLGGLIQIQPSEIAKLAFVLFAAGFLERRAERMTGNHWAAFLGVLGTLCAIIYKEPDLGTALVLAGTAFAMLISAGVRWRTLGTMALVGVVLVGSMAWITPHQKERLRAYWNPFAPAYVQDKGYQVVQSWMALARGGLWGVGLGQ
ncbi:MAG: spoVE, partial [Firmicutes bacterium]|nr:spoVE [Bacillota bacterium]